MKSRASKSRRFLTPKERVLKAYPEAKAYNRGYDRHRRCYWWQIWLPMGSGPIQLLGMARKSPAAAWLDAEKHT